MDGVRSTPRRRTERAIGLAAGTPLDQFATDRLCRHPECSARLSRYNPNPTCALHGGWVEQDRPTRRRPRPA